MLTSRLVVDRSRAVAAVYVRARVEGGLTYSTGESKRKWAALGKRLGAFVTKNAGIFSPRERKLLAKPLGSWNERARIDNDWRLEALRVLVWAATFERKLLRWDVAAKPTAVAWLDTTSWFDSPSLETVLDRAGQRAASELERAREVAELWHWRANTARAWTSRSPKIVADAARAAFERGDISRVIDGDFPWRRKAYAQLGEDQRSDAASIAVERHYALEWLTEHRPSHASWDRVRTDT